MIQQTLASSPNASSRLKGMHALLQERRFWSTTAFPALAMWAGIVLAVIRYPLDGMRPFHGGTQQTNAGHNGV